jgi:hypothetical protein
MVPCILQTTLFYPSRIKKCPGSPGKWQDIAGAAEANNQRWIPTSLKSKNPDFTFYVRMERLSCET